MSKSKTSFHIQHIARPSHIERILEIVSNDQSFNTESSHLRLTQDGHQIAFDGVRRSLNLGAKLGLFEKSGQSAYTLTEHGRVCRDLALYRHEVYGDVMHFLLFATCWNTRKRICLWETPQTM